MERSPRDGSMGSWELADDDMATAAPAMNTKCFNYNAQVRTEAYLFCGWFARWVPHYLQAVPCAFSSLTSASHTRVVAPKCRQDQFPLLAALSCPALQVP